ncbi:unnamed protein product [Angiostrongylus costaricensis]|uniref:Apyrase n=1 Tax=Angiostrongylus costaricensis TaxID=334426 RepID=A0A0R3PFY6_ANGCS|nr:unnamed protein product [Angiostrongylus costaricensis]
MNYSLSLNEMMMKNRGFHRDSHVDDKNDPQSEYEYLFGDAVCWNPKEPCHEEARGHCAVTSKTLDQLEQGDGTEVYKLLTISDIDENSKTVKNWTWRAVTRRGNMTIDKSQANVTVTWINGPDRNLTTSLNYKGRAMEPSDLSKFSGRLLAPDDETRLRYEIKDNKAIQWLVPNSGRGHATKGIKAERATLYRCHLIVGGHGTEYRNETGAVLSEDSLWIKVKSCDWNYVYKSLRKAVNLTGVGAYLTHEAAQWSSIHQKCFSLPIKESNSTCNETVDERKGTDLLIIGNPNLTEVEVVRIGNLTHRERKFSAFEFIPKTNDALIVALKSEELKGNATKSCITVFNISGHVLLED